MKAWKVIFATLVIFSAGLVVGGLVMKKISPASPSATRPANGNPGQFRLQSLLHRMDRELALTADQHAQIEKIISVSQDRTREIWKPVSVEMGKETTSACEQIREVLTPEQQAKFDTLSKARPERGDRGERGDHGDHGKRRGPHDNGPDAPTNAPPADGN